MEQSNLAISFTILLGAALVGGMIAHRLRQPVILGYLVIGMAIGPHALRLIGDIELVQGAATIGVALMMLTLGLEVSFTQLRQVGKVGLWGGMAQIVITFALGTLVGVTLFRWPFAEAAMFGLAISMSSTMIGLKTLMDRGELDAPHGRIMMAILILQDISVVLMMVVTPVLGGTEQNLFLALATAGAMAVLSIGAAVALGMWGLPWLMGRVGGVRSRELFLLTVLVLSLGAALSTQIFGLSAVFGAFLIGLVLRETKFAHQALAEITPLRDIFAALFFVSLGMLLDPRFVAQQWQLVAATVLLIIFTKTLVVSTIVRGFGYSGRTALLSGAGLFQIGEFSFILAAGGVSSGIVSDQVYSLILACAIITMLLTPLFLGLASRLYYRMAPQAIGGAPEANNGPRLPGAEIDKAAVPVDPGYDSQ
ncbi:MAG: cation:proton antiporter, partial [Dehalococcoidia bacterium]|nr:cation:proton antiporter [Dehalococcoidia bacterium]